jgi:hypothetical protein
MKAVFLRVLEAEDKAAALLGAVRDPERAKGRQRFEVDPQSFVGVPRSPFAYWISERLRRLFQECPPFASDGRTACVGDHPGDGFRYLRLWYERSWNSTREWLPYQKGGVWSPYYCDVHLVTDWHSAAQSFRGFLGRPGRASQRPSNFEFFFRPGITWPRRTTSGLSVRALPARCIFADKGPSAFVKDDDIAELIVLLALTNSGAFSACVELQLAAADAAARSYEVGVIQRTPIPHMSPSDHDALGALARRAWALKRSIDTRVEASHAFVLPALLQVGGADIAARAASSSQRAVTVEVELAAVQAEIDERCFGLYGIDDIDRRTITEGFSPLDSEAGLTGSSGEADDESGDAGEGNGSSVDATGLAAELVSWATGVAFGCFDIRLATGGRPMPSEPEPFDPLPSASPGMLVGDGGLPLPRQPTGYPLAVPEGGVLVDDAGHRYDLAAAVRAVFDVIFGAEADRWWNDVAALLDPTDQDLRVWVADGFFEHHIRRHSKSRRKAPVLWQVATPSSSYSVWLYAHRLTKDTLFQVQNDFVAQKLRHEERKLQSLADGGGTGSTAAQRKDVAEQEMFVIELRSMLDEVKRITPLWSPDLNDGVVLTMAPLWRLVPQHRSWQRELKTAWDALCAGNYDWAHIAMHLWPERVVPRCATDRSLAIAHGLEDAFWHEDADGKWQPRPAPTRSIEAIVRERTSPAVNAALKGLLEAPAAVGTGARGRRTAASAADQGAR